MASTLNLRPVDGTFSLGDHIYGVLREAILDMKVYDPATDLRLDERALSDALKISRTPVREALVRLEQDGFVEVRARKGVYVLRKSHGEIMEMITVWAALESMAARLATERASDKEIASLRAMAGRFGSDDAKAHIEEYSEANIAFHQRILELSQCSMLKTIADGLFLHMRAVRRKAMAEKDRSSRSVAEHIGIIEALETRDADRAAREVREHTMRLHDHVRDTWVDLDETMKKNAAG